MVWDTMEKRFKEMYIQQFEVDMKALVKKEAPDIFYWPSSPSSTGSMRDVENQSIGDSHDWNVCMDRSLSPISGVRSRALIPSSGCSPSPV